MTELWIFIVCTVSAGGEITCEKEPWPSYDDCTAQQYEYQITHVGEEFYTFCKRDDKAEIKT